MANGFGQSILNAFKDPLHDQLTSLGVPFGTIGLTAKAFRNYGNELVAAGEPFPEVTAENLRRMEKFHERSGQQPPNYQQWGGEWTGDQWVTTQQQRERAAAEAAQAAVDLRRQQLTDPYNLQGIGEQAIQEWMPAFNRMNQPADPVDATPVVATPVVATPERVTTIDTSTLPQPRLTEIDTSGFPQKRGATGEPSQSWQERLFGFGGGDPGMNMMMTGLRMLGNASQGQGFGQSLADAYTAQTGDARQLEAQSYARNQATLDRELAESELTVRKDTLAADIEAAERRDKLLEERNIIARDAANQQRYQERERENLERVDNALRQRYPDPNSAEHKSLLAERAQIISRINALKAGLDYTSILSGGGAPTTTKTPAEIAAEQIYGTL